MDYLNGTIKSLLDSGLEDGNYLSAKDKDVIVIGGGDTGSDCVATALRHGCGSVTQFGTHKQAPRRDPIANPWPQFPNVYTLDYAHEEAKALFGADPREFSIMTTKFVGDEEGNLKELHTVQIERIVTKPAVKCINRFRARRKYFLLKWRSLPSVLTDRSIRWSAAWT